MPTLQPEIRSPIAFSLREYRGSQPRTGHQLSTVCFNLGTEHLWRLSKKNQFIYFIRIPISWWRAHQLHTIHVTEHTLSVFSLNVSPARCASTWQVINKTKGGSIEFFLSLYKKEICVKTNWNILKEDLWILSPAAVLISWPCKTVTCWISSACHCATVNLFWQIQIGRELNFSYQACSFPLFCSLYVCSLIMILVLKFEKPSITNITSFIYLSNIQISTM